MAPVVARRAWHVVCGFAVVSALGLRHNRGLFSVDEEGMSSNSTDERSLLQLGSIEESFTAADAALISAIIPPQAIIKMVTAGDALLSPIFSSISAVLNTAAEYARLKDEAMKRAYDEYAKDLSEKYKFQLNQAAEFYAGTTRDVLLRIIEAAVESATQALLEMPAPALLALAKSPAGNDAAKSEIIRRTEAVAAYEAAAPEGAAAAAGKLRRVLIAIARAEFDMAFGFGALAFGKPSLPFHGVVVKTAGPAPIRTTVLAPVAQRTTVSQNPAFKTPPLLVRFKHLAVTTAWRAGSAALSSVADKVKGVVPNLFGVFTSAYNYHKVISETKGSEFVAARESGILSARLDDDSKLATFSMCRQFAQLHASIIVYTEAASRPENAGSLVEFASLNTPSTATADDIALIAGIARGRLCSALTPLFNRIGGLVRSGGACRASFTAAKCAAKRAPGESCAAWAPGDAYQEPPTFAPHLDAPGAASDDDIYDIALVSEAYLQERVGSQSREQVVEAEGWEQISIAGGGVAGLTPSGSNSVTNAVALQTTEDILRGEMNGDLSTLTFQTEYSNSRASTTNRACRAADHAKAALGECRPIGPENKGYILPKGGRQNSAYSRKLLVLRRSKMRDSLSSFKTRLSRGDTQAIVRPITDLVLLERPPNMAWQRTPEEDAVIARGYTPVRLSRSGSSPNEHFVGDGDAKPPPNGGRAVLDETEVTERTDANTAYTAGPHSSLNYGRDGAVTSLSSQTKGVILVYILRGSGETPLIDLRLIPFEDLRTTNMITLMNTLAHRSLTESIRSAVTHNSQREALLKSGYPDSVLLQPDLVPSGSHPWSVHYIDYLLRPPNCRIADTVSKGSYSHESWSSILKREALHAAKTSGAALAKVMSSDDSGDDAGSDSADGDDSGDDSGGDEPAASGSPQERTLQAQASGSVQMTSSAVVFHGFSTDCRDHAFWSRVETSPYAGSIKKARNVLLQPYLWKRRRFVVPAVASDGAGETPALGCCDSACQAKQLAVSSGDALRVCQGSLAACQEEGRALGDALRTCKVDRAASTLKRIAAGAVGKARLTASGEELAASQKLHRSCDEDLAACRAAGAELTAASADSARALDACKTTLVAKEGELATSKAANAESARALDAIRASLADASAKLAAKDVELTARKTAMADSARALDVCKASLADATTAGKVAQTTSGGALQACQASLADARAKLAAKENELAASKTALAASGHALEACQASHADASAKLAACHEPLATRDFGDERGCPLKAWLGHAASPVGLVDVLKSGAFVSKRSRGRFMGVAKNAFHDTVMSLSADCASMQWQHNVGSATARFPGQKETTRVTKALGRGSTVARATKDGAASAAGPCVMISGKIEAANNPTVDDELLICPPSVAGGRSSAADNVFDAGTWLRALEIWVAHFSAIASSGGKNLLCSFGKPNGINALTRTEMTSVQALSATICEGG